MHFLEVVEKFRAGWLFGNQGKRYGLKYVTGLLITVEADMGVEEPCGPFSISLFRLDETSEAGAPRTDTGRVICAKAAP